MYLQLRPKQRLRQQNLVRSSPTLVIALLKRAQPSRVMIEGEP